MADQKATGTVIPATEKPFQLLLRKMANLAELEEDGPGGFDATGINAILMAETEDEMWESDDRTQLGGRDLAEVEMELLDFQVKWSNRDVGEDGEEIKTPFVTPEGRKMYLLIQAVRISASAIRRDIAVGDEITFNTSAPLLVGKLFWLREHGKLPGQEAVIKATDLGAGRAVLKFKPIPKRAVSAKAAD